MTLCLSLNLVEESGILCLFSFYSFFVVASIQWIFCRIHNIEKMCPLVQYLCSAPLLFCLCLYAFVCFRILKVNFIVMEKVNEFPLITSPPIHRAQHPACFCIVVSAICVV